MELFELSELSNRELKNILRENQVKNYSKLNKKELVKKVNLLIKQQNGGGKNSRKNKKYTLRDLIVGGKPKMRLGANGNPIIGSNGQPIFYEETDESNKPPVQGTNGAKKGNGSNNSAASQTPVQGTNGANTGIRSNNSAASKQPPAQGATIGNGSNSPPESQNPAQGAETANNQNNGSRINVATASSETINKSKNCGPCSIQ